MALPDSIVQALGLRVGMVVQELGWDDDVDEELRESIMDILDAEMVEDAVEAVDVVVLWWRDEDGDVVDGLVDALPEGQPVFRVMPNTPALVGQGMAGIVPGPAATPDCNH